VLFVTGPNSPHAGELPRVSFDSSLAGSGIVAVGISSNVAHALFAPSGKDLKALQSDLDKENPHAESGFVLPSVKVRVATAVEHIKKTDRNVLAAPIRARRRALRPSRLRRSRGDVAQGGGKHDSSRRG
jgi:hypothetical protein